MSKAYDPHWPFPQYDQDGRRLLPTLARKRSAYPLDAEDALL